MKRTLREDWPFSCSSAGSSFSYLICLIRVIRVICGFPPSPWLFVLQSFSGTLPPEKPEKSLVIEPADEVDSLTVALRLAISLFDNSFVLRRGRGVSAPAMFHRARLPAKRLESPRRVFSFWKSRHSVTQKRQRLLPRIGARQGATAGSKRCFSGCSTLRGWGSRSFQRWAIVLPMSVLSITPEKSDAPGPNA
jgi:hypothetical protein